MEVRGLNIFTASSLSNTRSNSSKRSSAIKRGEDGTAILSHSEARGRTSKGKRESCLNCRWGPNSPVCKEGVDPYSEDNWCSHYEEKLGVLICAKCGKCEKVRRAGECPLRNKEKTIRDTVIREIKDNNVRWE